MPVIVNTPEPMVKVRVVTVKDYSEKTLKTLHKAGVFHIEESKELKPIEKSAIENERREVGELLTHIDQVLTYIPKEEKIPQITDIRPTYIKPFDEINNEVRSLYVKLANLHERITELNEEVEKLRELKKCLQPLAEKAELRLRDLNFSGAYLFSRVFVLPKEAHEIFLSKIKDHLFESIVATAESELIFYAIAKADHQKAIESQALDAGGKILQVPDEDLNLRDFLEKIESRINSLEGEIAKLYGELQSETRENLEEILLLREVLLAENERLGILEKACEAKYVNLIEGWVPEANAESAASLVKEDIGYVFTDIKKPGLSEEPPTKLRNPKGIKPFQVIVNLFGVPGYREWDPTPIIAYSFAAFFGLMLGDAVYAVGLILVTRFFLYKLVEDPRSEGFKLFKRLLYISGFTALIVGLLSGTYLGNIYEFFGIEGQALALVGEVRETLTDPLLFIILSLIIGLIHVNIAHLLTLVKRIREKGVVLNKLALFIFQIFGIPFFLHSLIHVELLPLSAPTYSIFKYIVFASMILIIASWFIQRGSLGVILWIFDIAGLLGDVMSYCRLAGVGLATLYLALSFNMMSEVFSGILPGMIPGIAGVVIGGIISIVILIFGHVLNLFLSSLTGFIHSLRLCFVEFLTKFYEGEGREYAPFALKPRTIRLRP